jgi:hypothetical protein
MIETGCPSFIIVLSATVKIHDSGGSMLDYKDIITRHLDLGEYFGLRVLTVRQLGNQCTGKLETSIPVDGNRRK